MHTFGKPPGLFSAIMEREGAPCVDARQGPVRSCVGRGAEAAVVPDAGLGRVCYQPAEMDVPLPAGPQGHQAGP